MTTFDNARPVGAWMLRARGALRRLSHIDPKYLIFALVTAILLYEIAVPLVILVWTSLTDAPPGARDFFSLETLTASNYTRALSPTALEAARNTTVFATGTTAFAFVLGGYLAWVVERTNTPLRRLIMLLAVLRLIIPGILPTVAWILLASPTIGLLNEYLQSLPGIDGAVFNIYSMWGMIWIEGLDLVPLSFLMIAAALRSMDPSLEEASLISGKGKLETTVRVTFPLILPAVLAALILITIRGIETFEVPALIGLPARIFTFVIEIYLNTNGVPADNGLAAVYAVFVLAFCAVLIWGYGRVTGSAEMFATISGKGFRPHRADLGGARWLTLLGALGIMVASIGLPLVVVVWASLSPPFQPIQPFTIDGMSNFTFENFELVLSNKVMRRAFVNSTLLGVGAALALVVLLSVVAWITVKTKLPGRRMLDHLAFAPIAIPSVLMGVAFLWLYLTVPIPIYGTRWILLLLYVAMYSPVVMRIMSSSMVQINDELLEASEVAGASWWRSFRTVALPLLKPGLLAGGLFAGIHAFRELAASLFVYTGGTEVVGVAMFSLWEDGSYNRLAAFGVLVLLVVISLAVLANVISSRFGVRE